MHHYQALDYPVKASSLDLLRHNHYFNPIALASSIRNNHRRPHNDQFLLLSGNTGFRQNLGKRLCRLAGSLHGTAEGLILTKRGIPNKNHLGAFNPRSEEHTSELQSRPHLVCRLLLEKKKKKNKTSH